jgi:hypothetical protein
MKTIKLRFCLVWEPTGEPFWFERKFRTLSEAKLWFLDFDPRFVGSYEFKKHKCMIYRFGKLLEEIAA